MGSGGSKPWDRKDYVESLFFENIERIATLVTSISYYQKQRGFYHPLFISKLQTIPDIQVTPQVQISGDDRPPLWIVSENEREPVFDKKAKKVVIRMTIPGSDSTTGHDITTVYFVEPKKLIFLDSQLGRLNDDLMNPFYDFLTSWTGEDEISDIVFPDNSCKMVQWFSLNCSTWSFFFSACVIFEGWEDPTSFFKSKSQAEMNHELRCFVAWIYFDLMEEELLEEKIFKYPNLDLWWLLKFPNTFDDKTKEYLSKINEHALFFMQHFLSWWDVFMLLGISDSEEQDPFKKIGSDFLDPHLFDEPCDCQKCGVWCMSKQWSVCKEEKHKGQTYLIPNPVSLEKYNHDEKTPEDYQEWLKNASPYLYRAATNQ